MKSPVPAVFEFDGFDSARHRYEMDFQISVIFAQNDSVKKSRLVKWGFKVRFQSGKALVPTHCFLGYDKDFAGNIVIVPKEAKVVRFMYDSYLSGMCTAEIAEELTKDNIPTAPGGKDLESKRNFEYAAK